MLIHQGGVDYSHSWRNHADFMHCEAGSHVIMKQMCVHLGVPWYTLILILILIQIPACKQVLNTCLHAGIKNLLARRY